MRAGWPRASPRRWGARGGAGCARRSSGGLRAALTDCVAGPLERVEFAAAQGDDTAELSRRATQLAREIAG